MANHSSHFAWRIPWTKKPSGLLSTGHKESDKTETYAQQHPKRLTKLLHINELTRYLKFLLLAIKYCWCQLKDRGKGPRTQECESLEPEKSS